MASPGPSPLPRTQQVVVASIAVVFGVVLSGIGLGLAREAAALQADRHAEGTIVGYVTDSLPNRRGRPDRAPIVEFRNPQGSLIRFTNAVASGPTRVRLPGTQVRIDVPSGTTIGAAVPVCYPAAHPNRARIDDLASLWLFPSLALGVGALAIVAGVLGALGRWKVTVREP